MMTQELARLRRMQRREVWANGFRAGFATAGLRRREVWANGFGAGFATAGLVLAFAWYLS